MTREAGNNLHESLRLREQRLDRDGNPTSRPLKVYPPGPDDWPCLRCKSSNFKTRKKCFQCGEPRPPKKAKLDSGTAHVESTLATRGFEQMEPHSIVPALQPVPLVSYQARANTASTAAVGQDDAHITEKKIQQLRKLAQKNVDNEKNPPPFTPNAGLPPGWVSCLPPGGRAFYVDHGSQKTQWELPDGWGAVVRKVRLFAPSLLKRVHAGS